MLNMQTGKTYIVTKASNDRTFDVGDHIVLFPDGTLGCREAFGWIEKEEFPAATKGMEVEIDKEWLEKERVRLQGKLDALFCNQVQGAFDKLP